MDQGYCDVEKGTFEEKDFSAWLSKADLQIVFDSMKDRDHFAYVEGRNNGGLHQYRHVTRAFDGTAHSEWAAFWGLTQEQFYKVDLKMGKSGFTRERLQVFEDGAGYAHHQCLWLKPKESTFSVSSG